jgi:carboxylate-amine ligase
MEKTLHLFEGFGIELEYMIVDEKSLSVFPVADEVIKNIAGEYANDVKAGELEWSNELALHVIELKTPLPVANLVALPLHFQKGVNHINDIMKGMSGRLMPTAMHPWMDPLQEMKLWPHDNSPIYEAYNRIFDCKGHGWANLQSMHLNLPFAGDEEFGRLHAAIRLILPILPALAASSPVAEGEKKEFKDFRLEVYRHNQSRIPAIAGKVIPEAVFTQKEYDTNIFQPLYKDIAQYDPEGVLQEEWLNSRGAIARWDRNAIEIRLLDIQECPLADISIAAFIIEVLKYLVGQNTITYEEQKQFKEDDLAYILLDCITYAEEAIIKNKSYLTAFGMEESHATANEIWKHLYNKCFKDSAHDNFRDSIKIILDKGSLATRILKALGEEFSPDKLKSVYTELCDCLQFNRNFGG